MTAGTLYFHSPCFDGIVSAVLAWGFLETHNSWTEITLRSVNYHLRDSWLGERLGAPAAVVDFLYHPATSFWADHHQTAFLTDAIRMHFETRRASDDLLYEPSAGSCAMLLWEKLSRRWGHREVLYIDCVHWADKIDSARYDSVTEVIEGKAPALRLNLGLALGDQDGYSERLVRALREQPLEAVAALPEACARFERATELSRIGLDRFKHAAHLDDGIAIFDVDSTDAIVSRYAPYYLYPDARYSAGIIRFKGGAKVTAMRNPWLEFQSAPLGRIAAGLGGGGHQRIGSVDLLNERATQAQDVLDRVVEEIRKAEKQP